MEYDSQAVQEPGKSGDDFGLRLSPTLGLVDRLPRLDYRLSYQPTYVQFVNASRDEDVDHVGSLNLDYAFGPRTRMGLDNRVTWIRSFVFESLQENRGGQIVTVADDNLTSDRIFREEVSLQVEHDLSERLTGSSSVSYGLLDAEDPTQIDSQGGSSETQLSYTLDARTALSAGGAFSYQAYEEVDAQLPLPLEAMFPTAVQEPASQSYVYQGFAGVTRRFGDVWSFSLRGGPTRIVTRQDGAIVATQVLLPGVGPAFVIRNLAPSVDGRWTFFGQGRLGARWSDTLRSSASYRRSQDDSSGNSGTSIRDSVSLFTSWQPAELWNLDLLGEWVMRNRANSTTTANDFDSTRWSLTGGVSRSLTQRASVALRFHLSLQETKQGASSDSIDQELVFLEFRYAFDPIRVWH